MTPSSPQHEPEVLDLSKQDDEIKRQATIQKVLDFENHNRNNALIQLMLDTYKQKVEASIRTELEEKIRSEYTHAMDRERIKYEYEALHYERDRIERDELNALLQKERTVREELARANDQLQHEKAELAHVLEEEKKARVDGAEGVLRRDETILHIQKEKDFLAQKLAQLVEQHALVMRENDVYKTTIEQKNKELEYLREAKEEIRLSVVNDEAQVSALQERVAALMLREETHKKDYHELEKALADAKAENERRAELFENEKKALLSSVERVRAERAKSEERVKVLEREQASRETEYTMLERVVKDKETLIAGLSQEKKHSEDRYGTLDAAHKELIRRVESFEREIHEYKAHITLLTRHLEEEKSARAGDRENAAKEKDALSRKIQQLTEAQMESAVKRTLLEEQLATVRESLSRHESVIAEKNAELREMRALLEEERKRVYTLQESLVSEKNERERMHIEKERTHQSLLLENESLTKQLREKEKELVERREAYAYEAERLGKALQEQKEAQESSALLAKELGNEAAIAQRDVRSLQKTLQEKIVEFEQKWAIFETEKKELVATISALEKERAALLENKNVLEKKDSSKNWEIDFLKNYVKERTIDLEKQQTHFAVERRELEDALLTYKRMHDSVQSIQTGHAKENERLRDELAMLQRMTVDYERVRKEKEQLETHLMERNTAIATVRETLNTLEVKYAEVKDAYDREKDRALSLEKQVVALSTERAHISQSLQEKNAERDRLEERLKALAAEVKNAQDLSAYHMRLREDAEKEKERLKAMCDESQRILSQKERDEAVLRTERDELSMLLKDNTQSRDSLLQKLQAMDRESTYARERVQYVEASLKESDQFIAGLKAKYADSEMRERTLQHDIQTLRLEVLEKEKQIGVLEKTITEIKSEKERVSDHGAMFRDEIARVAVEKVKLEDAYQTLLQRMKDTEKRVGDLQQEKEMLLSSLGQREQSLMMGERTHAELKSTIATLEEKVYVFDKKIRENEEVIRKYESLVGMLEREKEETRQVSERMTSENHALKREIAQLTNTTQDASERIEREAMKRMRLEQEYKALHDHVGQIEELYKKSGAEQREISAELEQARRELVLREERLQSERLKNEAETVMLKRDIERLTAECAMLSEQLKEIDVLQKEKYTHIQEAQKTAHEVDSLRSEMATLNKRIVYLQERVQEESHAKEDMIRELELVQRDKRLLDHSLGTYKQSIEDMQLLLQSEKERSKNLEREREHLKKCLDISQRAFSVNKQLTELKE